MYNNSNINQIAISIELLDRQERPLEEIKGQVISGSGSIDGDSSVRRTMTLVFLTNDKNYKILETSNLLSINKKVKISIGTIDLLSKDNRIKWYKMGIFVMSKCTSVASLQGQQITIILQDKMCLHNGDIAGKLEYTTRLDSEDSIPPFISLISQIQQDFLELSQDSSLINSKAMNIKKSLNEIYSIICGKNSALEEIIMNLFANINFILSLEDYSSDTYKDKIKEISEGISSLAIKSKHKKLTIREIIRYAAISLGGELPGKVMINDVPDKIRMPIFLDEAKKNIGFKMIDFIYPGELTLKTGEPLTAIYEKCKEALGGNYEYFYDLDGNFVFQEIKNYVNNNIPKIEDLKASNYKYSFSLTPVEFDFSEVPLINSYTITPNWNNIKNDFYVWGKSETNLIGYHAVIDDKPIVPNYVRDLLKEDKKMDWREYIIHNQNVGENNTFIGKCYFKDLNQMVTDVSNPVACVIQDDHCLHYLKFTGVQTPWVELQMSDIKRAIPPNYYQELSTLWKNDRYNEDFSPKDCSNYNFNFDIIEGDKELSKFSVNTIGRRKFPIEDSNIKQLYPTVVQEKLVYYNDEDLKYTTKPENSIKILKIEDFKNYPSAGNIYKDAFSTIKKILFNHTIYNEQVQVSSIPIYDLGVNKRCYLCSNETNLNGFFMIKKINFDLNPQGLMNISMIKTPNEIDIKKEEDIDNALLLENGDFIKIERDNKYLEKEKTTY